MSMSSSTSTKKKRILQNPVAVDIGCSCGRPKLSKLFFPKLKPKVSLIPKPDPYPSSTDTLSPSTTTTFDTTPFHSESEDTTKSSKSVNSMNSRIGESIAVEKDSNDPYLDFRHSMLNMILEKEIYSKEELKELLECFLSLNSPYHHEIIVRAFTEIWDGVFSVGQGFSAVSSRVRRRSREFQFSHV